VEQVLEFALCNAQSVGMAPRHPGHVGNDNVRTGTRLQLQSPAFERPAGVVFVNLHKSIVVCGVKHIVVNIPAGATLLKVALDVQVVDAPRHHEAHAGKVLDAVEHLRQRRGSLETVDVPRRNGKQRRVVAQQLQRLGHKLHKVRGEHQLFLDADEVFLEHRVKTC